MALRRGRRRQRGQEIIEFGLAAILFVPMLLGSVVTGMGLIRSIQVNHVCRDLDNIYIHGGDFSTYPLQELAQRLSLGLNLQVGSSFSGNQAYNTNNTGNGLVTVSQIMWVGSTTDPQCVAVGAANCTNHDKFVFTQRIKFGNGTLNSSHPSTLGDPSVTPSNFGVIVNPVTTAGAALPSTGQSNMTSLWQVSGGGRSPLVDGQIVYVVEMYFESPNLGIGSFSSPGVYARYFF